MLNRRSFITAIASLPILGRFVKGESKTTGAINLRSPPNASVYFSSPEYTGDFGLAIMDMQARPITCTTIGRRYETEEEAVSNWDKTWQEYLNINPDPGQKLLVIVNSRTGLVKAKAADLNPTPFFQVDRPYPDAEWNTSINLT